MACGSALGLLATVRCVPPPSFGQVAPVTTGVAGDARVGVGGRLAGGGAPAEARQRGCGTGGCNREVVGMRASSAPSLRLPSSSAAAARVANPWTLGALLALSSSVLGFLRVKAWFETPSRPYSGASGAANSVRAEYDHWTREGVLEHYWGEHIHMGYYSTLERQRGYSRDDWWIIAFLRATLAHVLGRYKDFVEAKLDFSKRMLAWSGAKRPKKILDVGCGIGGTSRFLARTFPEAEVVGITLSPEQAQRATKLAKEAGLENVSFRVMNALDMEFQDNTFDLVWGCESGEHMPDKGKYIKEMTRVLARGGNLVVATWCERDPIPPFTAEELEALKFVYEEWSHPHFISIAAYRRLMESTGSLKWIETADWTEETLPSWRHSIWVGAWSPWYWLAVSLKSWKAFLGILREAYTLERYHRGMRRGLLTYGMMKAVKA